MHPTDLRPKILDQRLPRPHPSLHHASPASHLQHELARPRELGLQQLLSWKMGWASGVFETGEGALVLRECCTGGLSKCLRTRFSGLGFTEGKKYFSKAVTIQFNTLTRVATALPLKHKSPPRNHETEPHLRSSHPQNLKTILPKKSLGLSDTLVHTSGLDAPRPRPRARPWPARPAGLGFGLGLDLAAFGLALPAAFAAGPAASASSSSSVLGLSVGPSAIRFACTTSSAGAESIEMK